MPVPIMKQGDTLIASFQSALSDREWREFHVELMRRVAEHRARGVILDVAGLDLIDSYAARTLRSIAQTTQLRGANSLLVGIQPDAAFAMVQLGLTLHLHGMDTALDLEDGLAKLARRDRGRA